MKEIYKTFNGTYAISNYGNIKNIKTNRILKLRPNHKGYLKTNIYVEGKLKTIFPHKLVAQMFIPNPNNKPQINHIDGNKQNNHISNLEWSTAKENMQHAFKSGLNLGNGKPVCQIDKNGNIINKFKSCREAEISIGCNSHCANIWNVCNGKRKYHKGYYWSYENAG